MPTKRRPCLSVCYSAVARVTKYRYISNGAMFSKYTDKQITDNNAKIFNRLYLDGWGNLHKIWLQLGKIELFEWLLWASNSNGTEG